MQKGKRFNTVYNILEVYIHVKIGCFIIHTNQTPRNRGSHVLAIQLHDGIKEYV